MKLFQKASAAVLAVCGVLSAVPGAQAAGLQDLPGQELWQPYLNAAPQDADSFIHEIRSERCFPFCRLLRWK